MLSAKLRSILRKARLRLSKPERWIQNAETSQDDDGRTCYCLIGALRHKNGLSDTEETKLVNHVTEAIKDSGFRYENIAEFNDFQGRRHQTVLRVLDRAIQA